MKSKRFTTLIAIFVMSLLACVVSFGTTLSFAEETGTENYSAAVEKYFDIEGGTFDIVDAKIVVTATAETTTITSKYDFYLEDAKVNGTPNGLTVETNVGNGFGKLVITLTDVVGTTDQTTPDATETYGTYTIDSITTFEDKNLYTITDNTITANEEAVYFKNPFADKVVYGYNYSKVSASFYHGFIEKIAESANIKFLVTTDVVDDTNKNTVFTAEDAVLVNNGSNYKFKNKGDHYVVYGYNKGTNETADWKLSFQKVETVDDLTNVEAPAYDAIKLQQFVANGLADYNTKVQEEAYENVTAKEWKYIGSSTYYEIPTEIYDYFTSNVFVNSDLEPVVYYKLPQSDSFTKLSSTSSTKRFSLTKIGDYDFYVLATDPLNNSLEIGEDWELTTVNEVKGFYYNENQDADTFTGYTVSDLKVPVFSFYLGNRGPQAQRSNSTYADGFVNVKYTKMSTFTIKGNDVTTTYKLYYRPLSDGYTLPNPGSITDTSYDGNMKAQIEYEENGWFEISDEEEFEKAFGDDEIDYSDLAWNSSSLDFIPVKTGYYVVKCEVVDGSAIDAYAFSAPVKVEHEITKAEHARVQVWFENNWKSLVFLGIALLSLVGIIVLLFVKPKEEVEAQGENNN